MRKITALFIAMTLSLAALTQTHVYFTEKEWEANTSIYITTDVWQAHHLVYLTMDCSECTEYAHWCVVADIAKADLIVHIVDKPWRADFVINFINDKSRAR